MQGTYTYNRTGNFLILIAFTSGHCYHAQPEQYNFNFSIKNFDVASTTHTAYIFSHGLANTHEQGILFSRQNSPDKGRWIIDGPFAVFDFCDAKHKGAYHYKEVNLGQEKDLERLAYAYQKIVELLPRHKLVCAGISRGAVAILNYTALYKPEQIKALVLESPFDTLTSVIQHLLVRYHVDWLPFSKSLGFKVCQSYFPQVNLKGIFPIDLVEKIPKDIVIMFIHSKKDRLIPINSSRRLYIKLKETDHHNVYLVELQSGNHGNLMSGQDADFYNYAVHAFYQKYDLAYNLDFARHGQRLLELCQPSVSDVIGRMKTKRGIDEESDEPDEYELDLVCDNAVE